MDPAQAGRVLVFAGLGAVVLGILLWGLGAVAPGLRLGRLPGDQVFESGGAKVYVPITTMLLVSALLTLLVWLAGVLRK
jgi:hypothetical protein